jgi:Arc/MetJ-type ribon-helix-helix transcriptional regulator
MGAEVGGEVGGAALTRGDGDAEAGDPGLGGVEMDACGGAASVQAMISGLHKEDAMPRDDDTLDLGSAKAIGERLVAEGRYDSVEEACRAGLRRLAEDAAVVDRLVKLGEDGMASGLAEGFDIDAFVGEMRRW